MIMMTQTQMQIATCDRCQTGQVIPDRTDPTDRLCLMCGHRQYGAEPLPNRYAHRKRITPEDVQMLLERYDQLRPLYRTMTATARAVGDSFQYDFSDSTVIKVVSDRAALHRAQEAVNGGWSWDDIRRRYEQMADEGYPTNADKFRELSAVFGVSEQVLRDRLIRDRTRKRNLQDGRFEKKLTFEQAQEIRRLYKDGDWTYRTLGEKFGVNLNTICNIMLGRVYTTKEVVSKGLPRGYYTEQDKERLRREFVARFPDSGLVKDHFVRVLASEWQRSAAWVYGVLREGDIK